MDWALGFLTPRVVTATPPPASATPLPTFTALPADTSLPPTFTETSVPSDTPTVVPPTRMAKPPTRTSLPTATAIPSRTAVPTATESGTRRPSALTITPGFSRTPTATRSASAAPTRTPTATPFPPGETIGIVATRNGRGLNVRDAPGGFVLGSLLPGTQVRVLAGRQVFENELWVEITTDSGLQHWSQVRLCASLSRLTRCSIPINWGHE